uniref:Uncharacterized protein n=1 Tax=Oryza sativa subsp. japonica TaxID=39947 RepID=Q9LIV7_ORYSJ|nr:hypothetical protein [Oryza sativa]
MMRASWLLSLAGAGVPTPGVGMSVPIHQNTGVGCYASQRPEPVYVARVLRISFLVDVPQIEGEEPHLAPPAEPAKGGLRGLPWAAFPTETTQYNHDDIIIPPERGRKKLREVRRGGEHEMVVLHVRWAAASSSSSPPPPSSPEEEEMEFLHECAASTPVEDVAAALAGVAALQARLLSLCRSLRERGAAAAAAAGEVERAVAEAESYASKEQVRYNRFLSPRALREHIKNIEKTAVTALQESPEALCLQQKSSVPSIFINCIDPDNIIGLLLTCSCKRYPGDKLENVQLWWAGKELAMGKKLCDYIGVNDKTKS